MKYHPLKMPEGTHYGNNRWEVYSPKIKRRVKLYSDLEYYNWLEVEMDPQVISFCEQPFKTELFFQEDMKSYFSIPDMIIEDNNHEFTLIEVKHKDQLREGKIQKQIKIQKEWAYEHNMSHKIFTDDVLQERYLLNAWKAIVQTVSSCNEKIVENHVKLIVNTFPDNSTVTIGEILSTINADKSQVITAIYYLIYSGRIELLELKDVISKNTEVLIYG